MADSGLTKLKSIFGFGDDLGFFDFDPDKKNGSGLQNRNSALGFGDDLGYDDFDPDFIGGKSKLQNRNSLYGFGDDLGFDDFEPDNSPLSKIAKQQNKIS